MTVRAIPPLRAVSASSGEGEAAAVDGTAASTASPPRTAAVVLLRTAMRATPRRIPFRQHESNAE
ncbi:hypothetical protein GCM10022630_22780 [Thermobifida alba]